MVGTVRRVRFIGAAVAGLLVLSACGGGSDGNSENEAAQTPEQPDQGAVQTVADLPPDSSLVAEALPEVTEVAVYENEGDTEPLDTLANPNNNGVPLVFLVDGLDPTRDRLPVYLPIPPNGTKGWIDADDVSLAHHSFRIKIQKAAHRLTLSEAGEPVFEAEIAVGRAGRDTPEGTYYTKELLEPREPNGVYGTFAYGLSGFTNNPVVAQEFGDGGVIGIHGTNRPELIGTDVSSGCIRMTNENIDQLVQSFQLPLGVPVEVMA